MKKTTATLWGSAFVAASLLLTGCGNSAEPGESPPPNEASTSAPDDANGAELEKITIGISQIVEHPSLDASREGFKEAFIDAGYVDGDTVVFDEQNAQGEQPVATSIASKFQSDGVDLVLAIATPTAQAAVQTITDIPILFTAVTEPEEAGLVDSWEAPGGNASGTSDLNPVAEQIELIKDIAPDAKEIGVIYSTGEVNSEVQVKLAHDAADELGLTIKEAQADDAAGVAQAVQTLSGVDAIYVPTDNTIVEALESVIQVAESNGIPMIVGEGDSVERGGLATWGINYRDLGYQTGEMAIRILQEGADPGTMPVETIDKIQLVLNSGAAERMNVTFSEELLAKADTVFEE